MGKQHRKTTIRIFIIIIWQQFSCNKLYKKENISLIHINSSVSNVGAFADLMTGIPYAWRLREMLEEHFDCEFWDKN